MVSARALGVEGRNRRFIRHVLVYVLLFGLVAGANRASAASIDLALRGADLRDVVMAIGEMGGFNVLADDSVHGQVTVQLKGIRADEALTLLALTHGLDVSLIANTYVVGRARADIIGTPAMDEPLDVRFFELQYVQAEAVAMPASLVVPRERLSFDGHLLGVRGTTDELTHVEHLVHRLDVPDVALKGLLTRQRDRETQWFAMLDVKGTTRLVQAGDKLGPFHVDQVSSDAVVLTSEHGNRVVLSANGSRP